MRTTAACALLALIPGVSPAFATDLEPLTLAAATRNARDNSLLLRKLRLELRAARKQAQIAGTLPPARFFASLRKEFEDFKTFKFPPFVGLTQPFDLFGKRRADRGVAARDIALAELAIAGFEQGLDHQVAQRYRALQYRQDLLLTARFSRDLAARFLDVASRRARAGAAPSVDLVRAETEHSHVQGEKRAAALAALRACRELGEAMGDRDWESARVRDRLPGVRLGTEKTELLALAAEHRVDLQALEQVASRFAAEAHQQRQRRKPVVSGELAVKQEENKTFEYGGLRVDFTPMWHGRISREVEARELQRKAALLERDDLARRVDIRVAGLLREVELLRERLDLFEDQELPTTARQLEMVDQGYRRGGLDNLTVLTAQRGAVGSIREYLEVLHEYHRTILELRRETGMAALDLTPTPTSPQVRAWLDP